MVRNEIFSRMESNILKKDNLFLVIGRSNSINF